MQRKMDLDLEECFKKELKSNLKVNQLQEFPITLKVEPVEIPELDQWRERQ